MEMKGLFLMNLAIVEDEETARNQLKECIRRFFDERKLAYSIKEYVSGDGFLKEFSVGMFDMIFMDIEMPGMNGMDSSIRLREIDKDVTLVFVTNLSQYAIKGYEVDASDYILKPLKYDSFYLKMQRIYKRCLPKPKKVLPISSNGEKIILSLDGLLYVSSDDHLLTYHTENGNYDCFGSMKAVEKTLEGGSFFRCDSSYIVNLGKISKIVKNSILLANGDEISISRPRKKDFLDAYHTFLIQEK